MVNKMLLLDGNQLVPTESIATVNQLYRLLWSSSATAARHDRCSTRSFRMTVCPGSLFVNIFRMLMEFALSFRPKSWRGPLVHVHGGPENPQKPRHFGIPQLMNTHAMSVVLFLLRSAYCIDVACLNDCIPRWVDNLATFFGRRSFVDENLRELAS